MLRNISDFQLPYMELRDDRHSSLIKRARKRSIIERASDFSAEGADLLGVVDALDFLQRRFPLDKADWQPNEQVFIDYHGNQICADAFWDFSRKKPRLYMRESVFSGLFSEVPRCENRRKSKNTIFHEFGHLRLTSHRRKINARARKSGLETSKRAAQSTAQVDWTDPIVIKARNLDLEEEANCFSYAAQVPVTKLDGSLSVVQISEEFDVTLEVAYNAALLAKDYQRAKLLNKIK